MLIDVIHQYDIVVSTDGHPLMPRAGCRTTPRKTLFLEAVRGSPLAHGLSHKQTMDVRPLCVLRHTFTVAL